jgi:hypothetical protein
VKEESAIVDGLVNYLLSCLDDKLRERVEYLTERFDLGLSLDDGRFSVLFPDFLVDFAPQIDPHPTPTDASPASGPSS